MLANTNEMKEQTTRNEGSELAGFAADRPNKSETLSEEDRRLLIEHYQNHVAHLDVDFGLYEMSHEFADLLDALGAQETQDSEFDYYTQCNGVHAELAGGSDDFEPLTAEEYIREWCSWTAEDYFPKVWAAHYVRLVIMKKSLDHCLAQSDDQCSYWYWDYEYLNAKERRIADRYEAVSAAYDREIRKTLEDICDAFEDSLWKMHDTFYEDEAAIEWIDSELDDDIDDLLKKLHEDTSPRYRTVA